MVRSILVISILGVGFTAITPHYHALLPAFALTGLVSVFALAARHLVARLIARAQAGPKPFIVIDGSNVMHWKDGDPDIETVREVVFELRSQGFTPGVMFDANAGHLLTGKYRHDDYFSDALGLPQDQVMVVPKGTPADPMILTFARDTKAPVVSNDRFRDWAEDFADIIRPDNMIKGGYKQGKLWLHISGDAPEHA